MPSMAADYQAGYRAKNKERLAKYEKRRKQKRGSYQRERKREIEGRRLRRVFNLSMEEYFTLLALQDYRCDICKRHQTEFKSALVVDHDRSCCAGERSCGHCVRGLLCAQCNLIIGNAGDETGRLQDAIIYLKRTRSWRTTIAC